MPKYCYFCKNCLHQFEIHHGMTETMNCCPECLATDRLQRIPQITKTVRKSNIGQLVEKAIEENREILRQQTKEKLKERKDAP